MMEPLLEDFVASEKIQAAGQVPAAEIAQAWAKLAASSDRRPQVLEEALLVLRQNRRSLHVGDAQVRLLLSLVTSSGQDLGAAALGSIRASAALIISIWVRRNFLNDKNKFKKSAAAVATLNNVAETYAEALQEAGSDAYAPEAVLMLGAVSAAAECGEKTRILCQTALVEELTIRKDVLASSSSLPEVLAGVGYAITVSQEPMLSSLTGSLITLWSPASGDFNNSSVGPPLDACCMILRLFEFLGAWLTSSNGRKTEEVEGIWKTLLRGTNIAAPLEVRNVKVVAAAGLLRGARMLESLRLMRESLEALVADVGTQVLQEISGGTKEQEVMSLLERIAEHEPLWISERLLHQLRCITIAVDSCRNFAAQPSVLLCLVTSLLGDVLSLSQIYSSCPLRSSMGEIEQIQEQLHKQVEGIIFKDVGALARSVCDQYRGVATPYRQQVESLFWKYSLNLYQRHRIFTALCSKNDAYHEVQSNKDLNRILEANFLTVVLFFSSCMRTLRDSRSNHSSIRENELAAYVLDSFSCLEYLRHVHLPEYSDTVKHCANLVSENRKASLQLANLLPSYDSIVQWPGSSTLEYQDYSWYLDAVQTSRVLFHIRVLCGYFKQLDSDAFESRVAPLTFLYICHPSKEVADAAHTLFALFISDSVDVNDEASLAEQLGVFYMTRAMEGYPDYTPFDGLVKGVTAMVRSLPPGSVTIIQCIDQLVGKAEVLFSTKTSQPEVDDDEAAHKIQALLLHLLLIVDIQILPHLLKQLAKLTLSLPPPPQKRAVGEAFSVISGSEDLVRKPVLVPWLLSLSFLSSKNASSLDSSNSRNSRL